MIVQAMVNLSASLGIEVLAEGAETPSEIKTLLSIGCEAIQGFGIAMPMPVAEVEEWILDNEFQSRVFEAQEDAVSRRSTA